MRKRIPILLWSGQSSCFQFARCWSSIYAIYLRHTRGASRYAGLLMNPRIDNFDPWSYKKRLNWLFTISADGLKYRDQLLVFRVWCMEIRNFGTNLNFFARWIPDSGKTRQTVMGQKRLERKPNFFLEAQLWGSSASPFGAAPSAATSSSSTEFVANDL